MVCSISLGLPAPSPAVMLPLLCKLLVLPGLKHQNIPQRVLPSRLSGKVLAEPLQYGLGMEKTILFQTVPIQQRLGPFAQRPAQPDIDRYAKTHFGAFDQFLRYILVEHLTQDPFPLASPHLDGQGKSPGEFDD